MTRLVLLTLSLGYVFDLYLAHRTALVLSRALGLLPLWLGG